MNHYGRRLTVFHAVCLFKEVEEIYSGLSALGYVLLRSLQALLRETQASFI